MIVEIKACTQIDGELVWCDNPAEADAFGVFMGEPCDIRWLADFKLYLNALEWAEKVAELHHAELKDYAKPH